MVGYLSEAKRLRGKDGGKSKVPTPSQQIMLVIQVGTAIPMTLQLFPAFLCISNSSDSSSRGDGEITAKNLIEEKGGSGENLGFGDSKSLKLVGTLSSLLLLQGSLAELLSSVQTLTNSWLSRFLRIERLLAPSSVALLFAVRDALRFCLLEMLSCNHLKIMTQVGILAEFSGGGSCRTGSQPWKAFQNENPPLVRKMILAIVDTLGVILKWDSKRLQAFFIILTLGLRYVWRSDCKVSLSLKAIWRWFIAWT
ncbi:hypothetical protein S245_003905, partial [Arachis hypogaea]